MAEAAGMSAVYATQAFSVFVTALGRDDILQTGDQRDSADAVALQVPQFFTSVPPTVATIGGVQLGYRAVYPGGADDPSGA